MTQTSMPVEERERCVGLKKDGTRCSRNARAGEEMCRQHAGRATPRTPTGLSEQDQADLFAALELGMSLDRAIVVAGVPRSTVYDWLSRSDMEGASPVYAAFAAGVERARATLEERTLEKLAGSKDWRAQAWLLERLQPDRYSRGARPGQMKMPAGEGGDTTPDNVIQMRPATAAAGEFDW